MKFVINTNYKSAGTTVLDGIEKRLKNSGHDVSVNDWADYSEYDVAIFMAPDSKIRESKKITSKLLCILFDPKVTLSWQIEEAKAADLLIVSSIEQRDFLLKFNKNIFIYYMFPDTPEITKEHAQKDKIIIGYHGNKQHLDAMKDASWALDELAKQYSVEFRTIYNVEKLGKWNKNIPKVCPVRHIQWSENSIVAELKECDIGIVPSVLPAPAFLSRPLRSYIHNPEGYNNHDYVQRFKFSSNPGRIYVFSQLHIPVVTDFTPSSCQMIKNGESGFLVGTKEAWYDALKRLVDDAIMRNNLSNNLKQYIDDNYSIEHNFGNFISFIKLNIKK